MTPRFRGNSSSEKIQLDLLNRKLMNGFERKRKKENSTAPA